MATKRQQRVTSRGVWESATELTAREGAPVRDIHELAGQLGALSECFIHTRREHGSVDAASVCRHELIDVAQSFELRRRELEWCGLKRLRGGGLDWRRPSHLTFVRRDAFQAQRGMHTLDVALARAGQIVVVLVSLGALAHTLGLLG